jgi:hypothetical protein
MTTQARRRRIATGFLAAVLIGPLTLAACGMNRQTSSPSGGADQLSGAGQGAGDTAPGAADMAEKPADPAQAPTRVKLQQRSIVYTGSMSVRVKDVNVAADRAADVAAGFGGLVGGDRRTLDEQRSEAQLTLRVPAERFAATLDELAKLGVEESRAIQTQDVTEAVVDLEARLIAQRASVERVRALMARAQTIAELTSIETEVKNREAELASLEARKNRLDDLVALSTITVNLRGPAAPAADEKPATGFVAGLKSGWAGFLESVKVVLTVAGWLLPWLIAIGIPVGAVIWILRRRRRPALAMAGGSVPTTHGLPSAPPADDLPKPS